MKRILSSLSDIRKFKRLPHMNSDNPAKPLDLNLTEEQRKDIAWDLLFVLMTYSQATGATDSELRSQGRAKGQLLILARKLGLDERWILSNSALHKDAEPDFSSFSF